MPFKLSPELTTVTPFSKFLALLLFITLPAIGFLTGMQYQAFKNDSKITTTETYVPDNPPTENKEPQVYINQKHNYTFNYADFMKVKSNLSTENLESADNIYVEVTDNPTIRLTIKVVYPNQSKDYYDIQQIADDIFQYESSSTANYLSPERNISSGPILDTMARVSNSFEYQLSWKDDTASGIDIYKIIPWPNADTSIQQGVIAPFIMIKYQKDNLGFWLQVLDTFEFMK